MKAGVLLASERSGLLVALNDLLQLVIVGLLLFLALVVGNDGRGLKADGLMSLAELLLLFVAEMLDELFDEMLDIEAELIEPSAPLLLAKWPCIGLACFSKPVCLLNSSCWPSGSGGKGFWFLGTVPVPQQFCASLPACCCCCRLWHIICC